MSESPAAEQPAHPDHVYTHGHHSSVLRSHQWRTAENSAGYLLPHLHSGQALLDIGCGMGSITADLAARVAPGRVAALDDSDEVLATARLTVAERGLNSVDFHTGDVHALEFADDTFDVVHAHQVLQHVADPVAALREMRRVCRPGGLVAVRDGDYSGFTWYPRVPELDAWMELYQRVARASGGEPDAGRHLLSWAQRAGFPQDQITPQASVWCHATPQERTWWSGMWSERIVRSTIAELAVRDGHATREDLERISAGWRTWGEAQDGWFALLHGELLCRA